MKKEVFFAIFLGLFLGIIITYGLYRARTTLLSKPNTNILNATPSPLPQNSPLGSLSITSPEDEIIQSSAQLTVAGTTEAHSFVVIIVNDQDHITTADDSGAFSVEITLEKGSNVILIKSMDEDGKVVEDERTVIYTTTSLDDTAPESTESATRTNEDL